MQATIRKWGNSLGLRIPKPLADDAGVAAGSKVEVSMRDGGILIRPVRSPRLRLDDLLEGVTPENLHSEIDSGQPVGREAW
jgi:antitoxin MazE